MTVEIELRRAKYTKAILMIVNVISNLNLPDADLSVLSAIINSGYTEVNSHSKEAARIALNKDKFSTNNSIKRLKDRGVLISIPHTRGEYTINPSILNLVNNDSTSFNFTTIE